MTVTDAIVLDVLDELEVTDTVFHDLAYTRPLAAKLYAAVVAGPRSDRVLLVGPNVALAHALVRDGRRVEIWHVPGVAITEGLRPLVTRAADLDELFGDSVEAADRSYDVVVLPFVLDAATAEPASVLAAVRAVSAPGARVIVALRRAGALDARVRALRGRSVGSGRANLRHSWSWPSAAPRRLLDTEALRVPARAAGFRIAATDRVVDSRATAGVDALPFSAWLRDHASHATKRAVPAVRDTLVATLTPLSDAQIGNGYGPELPHVTVVVVGNDPDRSLRVEGHLREQTYPGDRIDIVHAPPGAAAANAAARAAKGEIVAFTDDWSRPPAGWVESGVRAMGEFTAALAGGVLAEQGSAVPFLAFPDRQLRVANNGLHLAANSFYIREALLSVGGFDESTETAWGWDTSAATRLRAAGYPTAEDESAFVFRMYSFPVDRSWLRDEFERARQLPLAVRRDPSLRRTALHRRFFASPRTRGFDLALVGITVAVVRRKPAYALALSIPWARTVIEYVDLWPPAEWRTSVRNVRGIVLRNAVWLAGLAAGSVQARRIVL